MKVKEVIISSLNLLGRNSLAARFKNGGEMSAEESDTLETLLYCFNAVEDEVARKYIPLTYKETLRATDCIFYYEAFAKTPLSIKSVTSDGVEVGYELFPRYILTKAQNVTIEYEYSPSKKKIDGNSDFGAEAGEYLLATGMAAEYCLINGEIEAAEQWEQKYRSKIDRAQSALPCGGFIAPRRWV